MGRYIYALLCLFFYPSLFEWLPSSPFVSKCFPLFPSAPLCLNLFASVFICFPCSFFVSFSLPVPAFVCLCLSVFPLVSLCLPAFPFELNPKSTQTRRLACMLILLTQWFAFWRSRSYYNLELSSAQSQRKRYSDAQLCMRIQRGPVSSCITVAAKRIASSRVQCCARCCLGF